MSSTAIKFEAAQVPTLDIQAIRAAHVGEGFMHQYVALHGQPPSHCRVFIQKQGADIAVAVLVDSEDNRGTSVTNHLEFIAADITAQFLPFVPAGAVRWYQLSLSGSDWRLDRVSFGTAAVGSRAYGAPKWQRLIGWQSVVMASTDSSCVS
ncbi:hypothetical protein PSH29_20140 [Xanthomonas perforans]|nr:hypothetical protein [Xanthomonas perforans]